MTLILGRKKGMTQLFAEDGTVTGCTVVEAGPCVVMQLRTQERDGYSAVQLGFEDMRDNDDTGAFMTLRHECSPLAVKAAKVDGE